MRLIILNGPTGIGKSTVASRLQAKIPRSIVLDIDEIRRSFPNYRENPRESLAFSYQKAGEALEENLRNGFDVIIDKTISDSGILDSYSAVAAACGARVFEFILFADRPTLQKRADERGYRPGSLLTREKVGKHWENIAALQSQRPKAVVVDTANIDADAVIGLIEEHLAE
jgi:predicted kinase